MWHWKISQHAFHILIDKQIFNNSILLALENINKICSRYFAIQNVFHTTTSATMFNTRFSFIKLKVIKTEGGKLR
jgi:hypothetical protein